MSLVMRKPVFGVCDQARHKLACSATDTSKRLEILDIETTDIILSKQRITKALIRLRGCAGWSAPLLFAHGINRFSQDMAHTEPEFDRECCSQCCVFTGVSCYILVVISWQLMFWYGTLVFQKLLKLSLGWSESSLGGLYIILLVLLYCSSIYTDRNTYRTEQYGVVFFSSF